MAEPATPAPAPANAPVSSEPTRAREAVQTVKAGGKKAASGVKKTKRAATAAKQSFSKPEMPFLLAGTVALVAGVARDKGWPKEGFRAIAGTIVLVIVASLTNGTSFAPLVRAIGLLLVLVSFMAAIPIIAESTKKKRN